MPIPQDDTLPKEVVERVALIAYEAMSSRGAYTADDEDMGDAIVDGNVDVRYLVRVIAAALKEESHG